MRKAAGLLLLVAAAGCAPTIVPAPTVTSPRFPDLVPPVVPQVLASDQANLNQDRGWRFLQAGDLRNAEREFSAALRVSPGFYPSETGLGDLELARKDPKAALPHFDRSVEADAKYIPALVGRGQALLALARNADALASFESALALDPSLADVRRQVEVLKFRGAEENLKRARDAARAGRYDDAQTAYQAALAGSPESAFLYRELADVERQAGARDRALEHYRKAIALDPSDAKSLVQIGELLLASGDYAGAQKAYADALQIEPSDAVQVRLDAARDRAALAALPAEYKAIPDAPEITRADLAALLGVRLAPLLQSARQHDAVLITDVRNSWAQPWIMSVARTGVMEPFENHTFQPRALVRRVDLAQAVSRVLMHVAPTGPGKDWLSAKMKFTDMPPGHLAYSAASVAVASGVMTAIDGAFQPSKPVSGAEAVQAIDRLEAIARRAGVRP